MQLLSLFNDYSEVRFLLFVFVLLSYWSFRSVFLYSLIKRITLHVCDARRPDRAPKTEPAYQHKHGLISCARFHAICSFLSSSLVGSSVEDPLGDGGCPTLTFCLWHLGNRLAARFYCSCRIIDFIELP